MGLSFLLSSKPRLVLLSVLDLSPVCALGRPGPAPGFGRSLAELGSEE